MWLLLLLALTVETKLEAYVNKKWVDWKVTAVRVQGPWVVVQTKRGQDDGQLLFHQDDGWRLVHIRSRSTTIPAGELDRVGVPAKAMPKLLGRAVPASERSEGPWAEVFSRLPAVQCASEYPQDSWSLMLARNEIYARQGRPFQDPFLRAYFTALPWYRVRTGSGHTELSPLEKANVRALLELEQKARASEDVIR